MIPRTPPRPVRYQRDPLWERTHEFERLVRLRRNDPGAHLPATLTDAQSVAVEAEAASQTFGTFSRGEYRAAFERAMNEIRPRVVAPVSDTPTPDLSDAWRQPEARRLWQRVIAGVASTRTAVPSLHHAFSVMVTLGGMRATPHVIHAHDLVLNNATLANLFAELALSCEGVLRCQPVPTSYAQVTRHLPRLSDGLAAEVHVTLAEIGEAFSTLGIPVGRHLAVDGSLMPAWAQQRSASVNGKWDAALEARLRRRTPEAGYVAYSRFDGRDARTQARAGASSMRSRSVSASMRGYRLTALFDITTGLALAFDIRDATESHEPRVLREVLLPTLFEASPELDVTAIVGDAGYDDNLTHEHLATHYGIHLVAVRKAHALGNRGRLFKEADHRSVKGVRGDGTAICRAHGLLLPYAGLDAPRRSTLRPGEATDAAAFRSRFYCSAGCGKVSIPTRACWSNLPYYPHTPHGRPLLYAQRCVFLGRRNQAEAGFSSLQVGYKQGLDGAARVRIFDRTVNEALVSLSLVTRALITLRAERIARGELP